MDLTHEEKTQDWQAKRYWTSRDFHTSARLHLQHWLVQSTINFILHPSIPIGDKPLQIADIACGNGAWLSAASSALPTASLTGFDITPAHFPSSAFLPKNVSLRVQDVVDHLPASLLETFDIVHLRAFASIIKNNETAPLLSNVAKLLKPGGWLQWEEMQPNQMMAVSPTEDVGKGASQKLLGLLKMGGEATGVKFDWLVDLPSRLQSHHFNNIGMECFPHRPELYKAWTEDYLTVYEELASNLPPASQAGPNAGLTQEQYMELFKQVVEETNKGVVIHSKEILVHVAQKVNFD